MKGMLTGFFRPSVALMNRLGYSWKMALLASLMAVPIIVFIYLLTGEINGRIDSVHIERQGIGYIRRVASFLDGIERHRELTSLISSGTATPGERLANEAAIHADMKLLDQTDARLDGVLRTSRVWERLRQKWTTLEKSLPRMGFYESDDAQSAYVTEVLALMGRVSHEVAGRNDFYVLDTVADKLPVVLNYAGQARAMAARAASPLHFGADQKANTVVLSSLMLLNLQEAEQNILGAVRQRPDRLTRLQGPLNKIMSASQAMGRLHSRLLGEKGAPANPAAYFSSLTPIISEAAESNWEIMSNMDRILKDREAQLVRKRNLVLAGAAFSIAVVFYLLAGVYLSVKSALGDLVEASSKIAAGKLDIQVPLEAKDETALVAASFNEMIRSVAGQIRDQEQFASIVSHDLRSPAAAAYNFLDVLMQKYGDNLDPKAREYISYAREGIMRMIALIKSLADYSRVDSKKKAFERVDCASVLRQALTNLALELEKSGVEVKAGQLPSVTGDEIQLVQLFQNLIGNAIKFRSYKDKNPWVKVDASPSGREWTFRVEDNGIGMEKQDLGRIFQMFQRLHSDSVYSGSGVGLAICRKIVERHGGRIWAESEPGKGSTFLFTIPQNLSQN